MDVKDFMQTALTTVPPDTRVRTAYQMMTRRGARIRHLPVVTEEGTLIGIITDRDIRLALASDAPRMAEHELPFLLDELRVRDIMTPAVQRSVADGGRHHHAETGNHRHAGDVVGRGPARHA